MPAASANIVTTPSAGAVHVHHTDGPLGEISPDSIWPLVLALVVGLDLLWMIFTPWAYPIGVFVGLVVLAFWFWRGNEPGWVVEGIMSTPPKSKTEQLALKTEDAKAPSHH